MFSINFKWFNWQILGEVLLISVENKKTLNARDAKAEISCITWVQEKIEPKIKDILTMKDEEKNDYMKYIVSLQKNIHIYLQNIIEAFVLGSF